PNINDAERAFASRLISADQWADIFFANVRQTVPPSWTVLGGHVGIHGYGDRAAVPVDWTLGCIAVSNADIEYLYDRVPLGTPVIIGSGERADDRPRPPSASSKRWQDCMRTQGSHRCADLSEAP